MPVNQHPAVISIRAGASPPIRRLDIRVKLLGLLAILIWAFLFESPLYQLAVLLPVTLMLAMIHFPMEKLKALLLPLAPLFLLIIFFTSVSYPPDRFHWAVNRMPLGHLLAGLPWGSGGRFIGILQFPGVVHFFGRVTRGGIMLGLTFMLRIVLLASASAMFTLVSPVEDLLQLLQKLRFPYELSFIIITALRFIPILDRKRLQILDAQQARGANRQGKGVKNWFRAQIPVMVPLVINSIIMADTLSMAMLNRGFGYARTRTYLRQLTFSATDYGAAGTILLFIAMAIDLRFGLQLGRL